MPVFTTTVAPGRMHAGAPRSHGIGVAGQKPDGDAPFNPPVRAHVRITQTGAVRITQDGNTRITIPE